MKAPSITSLLGITKLSEYIDRVNKGLLEAISSDNPNIIEPLSRLVSIGGKRLRPSLLLAVVISQGRPITKTIIKACVAIELIHIGSLVHDDIIDNADSRWNTRTINSKEGPDRALIIGDYLLAKACEQGAEISSDISRIVAHTITELCDGQSREIADHFNLDRKKQDYLSSIKGKTAALFSATCRIAAICAGLDESKINSLGGYGEEFGMSFQLVDDLIDIFSTSELLGKPVGNDVKEGVYTMPVLLSLAGAKATRLRALLKDKTNPQIKEVINIITEDNSPGKTLLLVREHNKSAMDHLSNFKNSGLMDELINFPDKYLEWALDNLVEKKNKLYAAVEQSSI